MFCGKCGTKNEDNAEFCRNCGSKLKNSTITTMSTQDDKNRKVGMIAVAIVAVDVYDTNGSLYDDYTLYLQHENNEKKYSREEINERGLTFPESGEYQLRIVDNANTDNETIVSVTAVDSGGVEKIPIFTRCGLSNIDDLSQIEISSLTDMKIMGQNYVWSTEYKDGVANYQYTEPFQHSQSLEIDPNFFNFETISKESILNEEISGDQIHFTVSGEKVAKIGIAAVQQISGINNLEYGDVDVAVTLDNSGTVDQIVMNFDASVTYQGLVTQKELL